MLPCRREAAVTVLRRGAAAGGGGGGGDAAGVSSPPGAGFGTGWQRRTVCLSGERRWSGFKRGDGLVGLRGRGLIRQRSADWHRRCAQPSSFPPPLSISLSLSLFPLFLFSSLFSSTAKRIPSSHSHPSVPNCDSLHLIQTLVSSFLFCFLFLPCFC